MPADPELHCETLTGEGPVLRPKRLVFARYRLQRLVGRGGMGVVWLALDEKLDRPVALKFLPDVLFLDPAARDDLKRETRRSLDLTHPHIVRIHDFVEDEETAAIAMEYVDGSNLSQLRVDRPSRIFEVDDLRVWTAALCAALEYAHETGRCVHRDLKPSNLMVNARGVLKIADFGISCGLHHTAARVSAWSSTGGTLGYMSPQQLLGELASPADDIYSVGATLYELLTGKPPFFSGDLSAQIREIVPESIAARRGRFGLPGAPVPAEWERAIGTCLAKRPEDRPRNLHEVAHLLGLPNIAPSEIAFASHELPAPTLRDFAPRRSDPKDWKNLFAPIRQYRGPIVTVLATTAALAFGLHHGRSSATRVETPAARTAPIAPPSPPENGLPSPILETAAVRPASAPQAVPDGAFLGAAPAPLPSPVPSLTSAEIFSTPPGVPFQILASAYETPDQKILYSGETPATIASLPPGVYRVNFAAFGLAPRSVSLEIPDTGTARMQQDFPAGMVRITSQPAGAEIFCDGRSLGAAPVETTLLAGKHEFTARSGSRDARPRNVVVKVDEQETVAFDFRISAESRSRSRAKPKEDDSVWEKMSRTVGKLFVGDKTKKTKH